MGPTWHKLCNIPMLLSSIQHIEANIQLHTQFPSRNQLICADELIKTLLISWCDSCAWPSGTWLVFQVAVANATASLCYQPLFGLRKCSASVNECHWMQIFLHGGIQLHTLLHMHFHVRRHSVRLPFCCHLSHGYKI